MNLPPTILAHKQINQELAQKHALFIQFTMLQQRAMKYLAQRHRQVSRFTYPATMMPGIMSYLTYKIKSNPEKFCVYFWGYRQGEKLRKLCRDLNVSHYFVEDAFIRSINLRGNEHASSLAIDRYGMHFDPHCPTDLELILANHPLADIELIEQSKLLIKRILETRLSKYNNNPDLDLSDFLGEKKQKRVLILGQVPKDASLIYGCDKQLSNHDLINLAIDENPQAQIIYRPHPKMMKAEIAAFSNNRQLAQRCILQTANCSLASILAGDIDHAYCITSLSGFEALLRNIKVTLLGCPFYAGWGLTDDRQACPRRTRKLSLEQLFAGAYILYPDYINPNGIDSWGINEVINFLASQKPSSNQPIS